MEFQHQRYYPTAELPWENPGWGRASSIKGETPELVEYCRKTYQEENDCSVDAPFWVHRQWNMADAYTVLIMLVFLVPFMSVLWIPLFLCLFPPVLLNRLYIAWFVLEPSDVIPRSNCRFYIHCFLQFLLAIPAMLLAACILVYSYTIMFVFGMIYLIIGSLLQCRLPTQRIYHNRKILRPYQNGPSLLFHFPDIVVAVMGSVYRQQLLEFMFSFTNMFFVNPWMKYWMTANFYLTDLDHRFLTQIGQSMSDMTPHEIDTHAINAISRAKNLRSNRDEIDLKSFSPHYPFPPKNRRFAIGMQHGSLITTWVHTTHYRSSEVSDEGPIASLSHSVALPIYRVMLWRNNPYHIFTGYVEANISTGLPTQPKKHHGAEHPMWLINSHNKLAADRNFSYSLGNIDNFFDNFLPQFNHYIRLNVRGRDAADECLKKDRRLGHEAFKYQKMAEI